MGGGGGKGGGGDGGTAALQAQEQARQARIKAATDKINQIFADGKRDALYAQQRQNVLDMNRDKIQDGFQNAARQLRFNMARNGMFGGSLDVDSNAQLQRRNEEGLMQAAQLADNAAHQLRTQDENARGSLLSLAQTGIDSTDAAQQAAARMQANADGMRQLANQNIVGNIFEGLNEAYLGHQRAQGRNRILAALDKNNPQSAATTYGGDVQN